MSTDDVIRDLATPRRTSPLSAVFGILGGQSLRSLLPGVIIALSLGRVVLVLGVAVVVLGVGGVLTWLRRTWSFDGEVLAVDEGVFVRNQRRIPVGRIQHIELERRLRHQLLGLAAVRVETAGGSGSELRLDAITMAEARALQAAVPGNDEPAGSAPHGPPMGGLARDETGLPLPPTGPATPALDTPTVLVRLPPTRLLLAGITGPEVAAVLAALAVAVDALLDLGVDPEQLSSTEVDAAAAVVLVALAVPVWFATAGLISVVRRWDLTVTVRGDELRVSYGLARRQEFVMNTSRLQSARIAQRLLLRPFDRADLRLRSAGSGSGESSRVDIPLLAPAEIDRVLERVLPAAVPRPGLAPAPPSARRRAWIRHGLVGAVVAVLPTIAVAGLVAVPVAVAGAVGASVGVALGEAWWRGLGWTEAVGVHHSRVGALSRRTAVVPVERLQSAGVRASWFQRRRGLASTRLDLVGEHVVVEDRSGDEAAAISHTAARVG